MKESSSNKKQALGGNQTKTSKTSMLRTVQRIWGHINPQRHLQVGLLLILIIISAFAGIISLGAVAPFLGVLIAPEQVFNKPIVADIAKAFGITSANDLILPLTIFFATATVVAGCIRVFFLWSSTRLSAIMTAEMSHEMYRRTLYQPYQVHLSRNSSVVAGVTSKVHYTGLLLQHMLLFLSSIVLLVAVLAILLVINTAVSLALIFIFASAYGFISWFFNRHVKDNSLIIQKHLLRLLKICKRFSSLMRQRVPLITLPK